MDSIRKQSLIDASLTTLYVIGIGLFIFIGGSIKIGKSNAFLAPIAFLMLFVTSAAITGYLVFGKPILMYLDGKKKDALRLLFNTFGFLFIFTFLLISILCFLNFK